MEALRIGVLNLMHDKEATRRRFTRVLEQPGLPVKLTFFYPVTHYTGRPVPEAVAKIARPLDLELAAQMDGFIHNWREYPHFDKWGMNRLLKAR